MKESHDQKRRRKRKEEKQLMKIQNRMPLLHPLHPERRRKKRDIMIMIEEFNLNKNDFF
jgi:hypothetical protein